MQRKESGTFARKHWTRAKAFKWLCTVLFSFMSIRLARSCARSAANKREKKRRRTIAPPLPCFMFSLLKVLFIYDARGNVVVYHQVY